MQTKESCAIFNTEQQTWPEYSAGQSKKRNTIRYVILIFVKKKPHKIWFLTDTEISLALRSDINSPRRPRMTWDHIMTIVLITPLPPENSIKFYGVFSIA